MPEGDDFYSYQPPEGTLSVEKKAPQYSRLEELPPIETPVVEALELPPHTFLPYDYFPKAPPSPTVKDIAYEE